MNRNVTIIGLTLAAGLALVACSSQPKQPKHNSASMPAPIGRNTPPSQRPRVEMVSAMGGPADGYAQTALLAKQRVAARAQGVERVGPQIIGDGPNDARPISVAFNQLDAKDALRVVIGELLGRNFIIDPEVNGQITLEVEDDLSTQDLFDLLDALAIVHGWSIENRGDTLVVRSLKNRAGSTAAPILTARSANPSERPGVRVFPLQYVAPQQAGEAVKLLLSPGGVSMVAGRMLLVADSIAQLNRLGELIRALDKPAFDGVEIWTFELAHQTPLDAVRALDAMVQQTNLSSGGDALASFVPVPRTRRLMVISRDATLQPMLEEWVRMVDQSPEMPQRHQYLYHIQHMNPTELKNLLEAYYTGRIEQNPADPTDNRMRLVVSVEEELLLMLATPADYADIMGMIERIDRPRQQVQLQAVIAEVNLSDSLEYGVEYFLSTEVGGGLLDLAGTLSQFAPANPAGTAVFLGTSGFAVLEALKTKSNVSLLSAPSTFVRDNSEASLKVGQEVPIISSQVDSTTQIDGSSGVRNEVEYRDTGIILGVTPKINESGEVTMTIKLEVTDAVPTTSSGIDSPTFTTRIAETVVTVPHGMTVLIGGAIETRATDRNSRIPILGDIPGIGLAFQSQRIENQRTELLLAITPNIVNDPRETNLVVGDFLQSSYGLRDALRRFVAPIPDVLRTADASSALEEFENAFAHVAPQDRTTRTPIEEPEGAPLTPTRRGELNRLASAIPSKDAESEAVAHFLSGLAAWTPGEGEG